MGRKDPAWKYGTEIPNPTNKGYKYIECNFGKQKITGGVKRMKNHLVHTHINVKPCPNVPDDVKKEILDFINKKDVTKKMSQEAFDDLVDSGSHFGVGNHGSNSKTFFTDEKRSTRGPIDNYVVRDGQNVEIENAQAMPLPNPKEARNQVSLDIGRFFFENSISFNAIESPSFVGMCRSIGRYGTGLKTPSRHELSTWILKEEVKSTETNVEEVRKNWIRTGVSILSDGWKDMKGRSLINFLVNNPYGTVFLKSIDASDAVKDANMLFELLDGIVEEVGEDLVVQVVTDNASNYKAAGKLLMEKRKRLYWTPCVAHCIDLILERIGMLPQMKNVLSNARKVSNFIYNHGFVLALMRKFTKRELIHPAVTRFATAILTLESMVQSKQPLQAMFTSLEWATSTWANKNEGKAIKKIVLSENTFWPSVAYALNTTRPLVKVLRMVDGEKMPAMGFIYGAMDEAKEEIAKNLGNDIGNYKEIWQIIDEKWELQLHHDIHAAAHFLNPRYQYAPNFSSHVEIKRGLINCMSRMISSESLSKADEQLDDFREKRGLFRCMQALSTYKTRTLANWWIQFGDETPELQSFAVRVLSLTCSSSACERNWSMFNQVHTKKRNRLTTHKLNSLVYIMYNKRLRERMMKMKSRDDIDPLEVDHLPSDDEWYVDGNETSGNDTQLTNEEFEFLLDDVPNEEGTSSGRGSRESNKRKKRTNEKGKSKTGRRLIDEEEPKWEDEKEDSDEEDYEIPRTRIDIDDIIAEDEDDLEDDEEDLDDFDA